MNKIGEKQVFDEITDKGYGSALHLSLKQKSGLSAEFLI